MNQTALCPSVCFDVPEKKKSGKEIRRGGEPLRCSADPPGAGYRSHGLRYVER